MALSAPCSYQSADEIQNLSMSFITLAKNDAPIKTLYFLLAGSYNNKPNCITITLILILEEAA